MSQTHGRQKDLFRLLVAEGRKAAREQGREEGVAEAILAVLRARGIEVPVDVAERIRACRGSATLQRWLGRAVTAQSAEEVVR